jgi:hypothetical protein
MDVVEPNADTCGIDLRVFQIQGKHNVVAAALSCRNFEFVRTLYLSTTLGPWRC